MPSTAAFTKLRSLTWLGLALDIYTFVSVMDAVVPLTGLTELTVRARQPAVVPAALGQLKGLRELNFLCLESCVLEAGCLDLPNLLRLELLGCSFEDASILPGITALEGLTHISVSNGQGPPFFAKLLQLPRLEHLVSDTHTSCGHVPALANVGCLKLAHLCFFGHGLPHFPSALTQLVALEYLDARANEFAELPAGITALLRLTALLLGRCFSADDPLQMLERVPLDTRALGDLSGFPSLRELTFDRCEVMLCESLLGAARHASLVSIDFCLAYPASECALVVLQLSQALKRLGRGSVLRLKDDSGLVHDPADLAKSPFHMFGIALKVCGL